ncbi:MAG: PIN domain-containing protein [Proteobacteria bacterium]|nr:PIN domain-containing protein [Pseudomonadota bacterium]
MTNRKAKLPDTNTIIGYLLRDNEELYGKAQVVFEKVRTGTESIIILESVLVECVCVLLKYYNVPKSEASTKLKQFLGYKGILNKDKKELIDALDMFAETSVDIVDCILYVKAKNYKMSLFTFDSM